MGQFTTGVLASTAPWTSSNAAWQANVEALAAMFEPVAQLVMDSGSPDHPESYVAGYSTLLNVDTCPDQYLPYLGMFIGIYIAPGTDGDVARAIINTKAGWARGTPAAIIAAAQTQLTGTQSCVLIERAPDAYSFQLIVRPEEVISVMALTIAVNLAKPAGVVWTLVQTDGWTLYQMESDYATISLLEAAFETIAGLENDQVGH